jgi:hypothetical protein
MPLPWQAGQVQAPVPLQVRQVAGPRLREVAACGGQGGAGAAVGRAVCRPCAPPACGFGLHGEPQPARPPAAHVAEQDVPQLGKGHHGGALRRCRRLAGLWLRGLQQRAQGAGRAGELAPPAGGALGAAPAPAPHTQAAAGRVPGAWRPPTVRQVTLTPLGTRRGLRGAAAAAAAGRCTDDGARCMLAGGFAGEDVAPQGPRRFAPGAGVRGEQLQAGGAGARGLWVGVTRGVENSVSRPGQAAAALCRLRDLPARPLKREAGLVGGAGGQLGRVRLVRPGAPAASSCDCRASHAVIGPSLAACRCDARLLLWDAGVNARPAASQHNHRQLRLSSHHFRGCCPAGRPLGRDPAGCAPERAAAGGFGLP